MVKRVLISFCDSKYWTKQVAARGAGNRHFWRLSAPRAHRKAPYKTDSLWKMCRVPKSPGAGPDRVGERGGAGGGGQARQPLVEQRVGAEGVRGLERERC